MKLKDINFEYIEDFVGEIVERVNENEDCFISVFAKYEQARDIIKYLLSYEFAILDNIELHGELYNNYIDEFIVEIWAMDGFTYVSCEPAKRDGKYFNYEGDICYLLGDCNSKIIQTCEYDEMYDVIIDEYEDDDCDCDDICDVECLCDCHKEDKDIANVSKSSYFVNGRPVTKEEYEKKSSEIQSKYEKNVKHILDDYHSFMDDFIDDIFDRLW